MRSNQGSARRAGSYPSYLSYLSYQSYLYTSQPLDPETSLYNYSARLYNPKLAQFTSPDSLITHNSLPTTHNSFTYARQNPLGFQQPLPLETFQPPQIPETPQTAPSTQPSLNPPLRIRDYTEVIRERVEGKYNIRFSAGDSPWTAAEMLHIAKILDLVSFHLYGNIPTLESSLEFVHNLATDYPAYFAGKNAVHIVFSEKFTGGRSGRQGSHFYYVLLIKPLIKPHNHLTI